MKKSITLPLVKRNLLLALLILLNAFTCNAQWTYTKSVKQTGSCIPFPLSNVNPRFNTKSECEAYRQSEINSVGDWSVFGDGSCTTTLICTPCMGSDIGTPSQGSTSGPVSIPGQVNPGDVSISGILEGKAIFTTHQSSAFEDWALEYKQLLASYGITSILGANFKFPRIPLTDDKAFNILYITLSSNFRPMIRPVITPRIAPSPKIAPSPAPKTEPSPAPKTELPSVSIPVMGGSPLTQAERERQNLPNKNGQYIDLMTYIRPESGIEESTPATAELSDSKEYKMVQAVFDKIGEYKIGELPAFTGGLLLSTVNETDKLIRDITINEKYSAEELAAMNPVKVIVNNVITEQVKSQVKQKIDDMKESLGLEFLGNKYGEATKKGAELGLKLMNETNKLQELWAAKRH